MNIKDKAILRNECFNFLKNFGDKMGAKFSNICSKTVSYSVPLELFQKRTPRKNRVLISWQAVHLNNLKIEHLNSFEGGVVVEFINNDFFDEKNKNDETFQYLTSKMGSDENISSIITIRSEEGSSSSAVQRTAFNKLINNTKIFYKDNKVILTKENYQNYAIQQNIRGKGQGNETWSGFLFISIRGGHHDKIETHAGQELTLFNPACEYASEDVCKDIDLVMSYFALMSIDKNKLHIEKPDLYIKCSDIISKLETSLKSIYYDNDSYSGNLFNFVKNHYSISLKPGQLTDPIQLSRIDISNFNISSRTEDSIDLTHEEAVIYEKYYWDKKKKCILSPARPTNVFWSYHLSNMMQQNYNLDEYFKFEEKRFKERQDLISKANK